MPQEMIESISSEINEVTDMLANIYRNLQNNDYQKRCLFVFYRAEILYLQNRTAGTVADSYSCRTATKLQDSTTTVLVLRFF